MQLKKGRKSIRVNTFNILLLVYSIICLFWFVNGEKHNLKMMKNIAFRNVNMPSKGIVGNFSPDKRLFKQPFNNRNISKAFISTTHIGIMNTQRKSAFQSLQSLHNLQQYCSFGRYKGHGGLSISSLFSQVKEESEETEEIDPGEVAGLRILKYPDPRLREQNEIITSFDEDLKTTAKNMFKIMYAAKGVGLAAPQVGINKRLLVFNPDGDSRKWLSEVTLVNPVIIEKSSKKDIQEEGCLSFPNMSGNVERHLKIKVEFENLKGKKAKKVFTGWEARIFQHEYDHLEGTLYIDRLDEDGRDKVKDVLDELIETHGPGGSL